MADSRNDIKRTRITTAPVPKPSVANTVPSVRARPVDSLVAPADTGLMQLAEGLSKASPSFKAFFGERKRRQQEADLLSGEIQAKKDSVGSEVSERIGFNKLDSKTSEEFQRGYIKMTGMIAGQRKAAELRQLIQEQVIDNEGDFDSVMTGFLNENLKGLDDDNFAESFLNEIAPVEQELRKAHVDYQRAVIDVEKHTGFGVMVDKAVSNFSGLTMSQQSAALKALDDNAKVLGLSNDVVNEIVFQHIAAAADEGAPELLDVLKETRANGTPGLYFNPKYTTKIDNAYDQAEATRTARLNAADTANNKQQAEVRKNNAIDLFGMYLDGEDIAGALRVHVNNHTLEDSDISKFVSLIDSQRRADKSDADKVQTAADKLRSESKSKAAFGVAVTGGMSLQDIIRMQSDEDINPATMRSIFTAWQDFQNPETVFKQTHYSTNRDWVGKSLAPQKDMIFNTIPAEKLAILNDAERAYDLELYTLQLNKGMGNLTQADTTELADKIVSRYKPMIDKFDSNNSSTQRMTREELDTAYINKGISQEEYDKQDALLNAEGK